MSGTSTTCPSCFRVTHDDTGEVLVIYRMSGRIVVLVVGLLLALASATFVVVSLLSRGLGASLLEDKLPAAQIVAGWVAVTSGAALFLGMYFLKTIFQLNNDYLTVQKKVVGFSWSRRIARPAMTCFEQVAVPSTEVAGTFDWDLIVRSPYPYRLLNHVKREATDWLGRKLADFYKVEFKPSSIREQNG